jgi:hypothetical protein
MKTGQRCAQTDNKEPFDKGLQITVEKPELPTLQAEQTTIKGGKCEFVAVQRVTEEIAKGDLHSRDLWPVLPRDPAQR